VGVRRVYDSSGGDDGYRVLVDRLWPRGIKKTEVALNEWAKDVAPSDELRRWYGHDPAKFEEFARRYRQELSAAQDPVRRLVEVAARQPVILLTATRDVEHSGAMVLAEYLTSHLRSRG
jgi:uncharacterized protein YeaO (DUF488 family)